MMHPNILQVEDEPAEVLGPRRAIEKARHGCRFYWVRSGGQAIDFLSSAVSSVGRGKHPLPSLVLLDLSLPGVDGLDLLAWVSVHPQWRLLPFIVLSRSMNPEDERRAMKLGAAAFFPKGEDYSELGEFVQRLFPSQPRASAGVLQAAFAHRRIRQARL
jgi:CheY-like chemotaxis protein